MWRPSRERRRRRSHVNRSHLAGSHVYGGRGTQFHSVGEVHFDPDLAQDVAGRVFHRALEGVAWSVVAHDEAGAAAHHVEGLVRSQHVGAGLFTAAGAFTAALAAGFSALSPGLDAFASAAALAAGFAAPSLGDALAGRGAFSIAAAFGSRVVRTPDDERRREQCPQERPHQERLGHQLLDLPAYHRFTSL